MSTLEAWLLIAVATSILLVLWTFLNWVFDLIEDYHEWWREQRYVERVQAGAEDPVRLTKARGTFED